MASVPRHSSAFAAVDMFWMGFAEFASLVATAAATVAGVLRATSRLVGTRAQAYLVQERAENEK